jgi:hypothetical protein
MNEDLSCLAGAMDLSGDPWLTPEQIAAKLGLSLETISTWRTEGHGPQWVLVGDELRCNAADFSRWLGEMTGATRDKRIPGPAPARQAASRSTVNPRK